MRVIHIIPLAFNYFNDISKTSFTMVDGLVNAGVDVDVITLQYGAPTRTQKEEVAEVAPTQTYVAEQPVPRVVAAVEEKSEEFDAIHIHCPFFGGLDDWYRFKMANPDFPLVITYHHDFRIADLLGVYIKVYNRFQISKFFKAADVVTCFSYDAFYHSLGWRYLRQKEKLIPLLPDSDRQVHGQNALQPLSDEKNTELAVGSLIDIYAKLKDGYRLMG